MREKEEDGHSLQQPNSLLDCVVRERTLKVDDSAETIRRKWHFDQRRKQSKNVTCPTR
jgi:hypothetical protein